MLLALLLPAFAQEEPPPVEEDEVDVPASDPAREGGKEEDEESWGFEQPKQTLEVEVDDAQMADFVAEQRKKAPPPDFWHLDPAGRTPLHDDFDIQVVAFNEGWLVVELPVLVATGRAAFRAEHPGGLLVVGEITSGGHRIVQQHTVTPDAVLEDQPTLVFLKAAVPNPAKSAEVRFLVKVGELPTPPAAESAKGKPPPPPPPPPPTPPKDRYARTTVFTRK